MLTLDDLHRGDRNDAGRYRSNKDGHKAFLRAAYHARWTVRLVVEETVKRKPVPDIGRESILILLLRDDLKPGRENMWCLAEPDRECIAKWKTSWQSTKSRWMLLSQEVCLDEKPVSLP